MVLRETEYERGGDYREMTANEKGSLEYYGALWGSGNIHRDTTKILPSIPQTECSIRIDRVAKSRNKTLCHSL